MHLPLPASTLPFRLLTACLFFLCPLCVFLQSQPAFSSTDSLPLLPLSSLCLPTKSSCLILPLLCLLFHFSLPLLPLSPLFLPKESSCLASTLPSPPLIACLLFCVPICFFLHCHAASFSTASLPLLPLLLCLVFYYTEALPLLALLSCLFLLCNCTSSYTAGLPLFSTADLTLVSPSSKVYNRIL